MATQFTIISNNDSGLLDNNYCMLNYQYSDTGPYISSIKRNDSVGMTLGTTVNVEYWADPTLGSGIYTNDQTKALSEGISLIFDIMGCSGIYSRLPITLGSWNYNLNGIEIDTVSRPDMNFKIGGDYATFKDSIATWSGGYCATIDKADVTLTTSGGNNLLLGGTKQTVNTIAWQYDLDGLFNLYVPLRLDLSNAGGEYEFTHPDFYLSGCLLNIKQYDKNGILKVEKSYTGITINPPNINGSITSTGVLKTVSDVGFQMSRDSVKGSQTYTELNNVVKHIYNMETAKVTSSAPTNYLNNNISSEVIKVSNIEMKRGDYSYITYEPKLQGIKPGVSGGIATTSFVTNCRGHKFSIDNVSLKIRSGAVFGDDVLDEVVNTNPYIYVDEGSTSGVLRVTFDANHEDWTTNTDRDNYADSNVYPFLSKIYLIASLPNNNDRELIPFKRTFIPYDDVQTYPNVDPGIGIINTFLSLNGIYYTLTTLGGSDTSLTGQTIDVTVLRSGKYKVFLALVDQYDQVSFWCITNKLKNYNAV